MLARSLSSNRGSAPARPLLALVVTLLLCSGVAGAGEVLYADGRRERGVEVRQDRGRWMVARDGAAPEPLLPGDVVLVVDAEGKEVDLVPKLDAGMEAPETAALLSRIADPADAEWFVAAEALSRRPTQMKIDGLSALRASKSKDVRGRAIAALARLRTRESTVAAVDALLAEADPKVRGEAASALFSVRAIFARCERGDRVERGLADKEAKVRFAFAAMAAPDDARALAVLRGAEGLKNRDHHVRESAAELLAERGDPSGESVLTGMLARKKLPGVDDPALMERLLRAEQARVCDHLGRLATPKAKAALLKAKSSPYPDVARAAERALAEIERTAAATKDASGGR